MDWPKKSSKRNLFNTFFGFSVQKWQKVQIKHEKCKKPFRARATSLVIYVCVKMKLSCWHLKTIIDIFSHSCWCLCIHNGKKPFSNSIPSFPCEHALWYTFGQANKENVRLSFPGFFLLQKTSSIAALPQFGLCTCLELAWYSYYHNMHV